MTCAANDFTQGKVLGAAAGRKFSGLVKRGDGDACWEWQGGRAKRPSGALSYGIFCVGKRRVLAHRAAWMLVHGAIPDGQVVRHRCDNVACVRPEHLQLGTQADNMADMWGKGRGVPHAFPVGERHPSSKVTAQVVRDLRRDYAAGESCAALGARVGLHASTVHDIVTGKTWKHVAEVASP